ncbi:glycoside hydrolase family 15 protein [Ruania albidiflava]|uniref:glycoside hydrolase family 15 protein n=1 Tax=Ruania albidiflava TaxID=366586 RepID=UPI0003B63BCB|nr:glycoside hydrolase family 15 protein [Ruania albidiflava]
MSTPIGDYALLADLHTGPLVSRGGSIDWLCLPRFDSAAVFAAILGTEEHGRWLMAPAEGTVVEQHYEAGTFVLRTQWRTPTGEAEVIEFMPIADDRADLVRQVRCTSGTVRIEHDLRLRPDYGDALPWVRRVHTEHGSVLQAITGPDSYVLRGPRLQAGDKHHRGSFELSEGQSHSWVLTWVPSHAEIPEPLDITEALTRTRTYWQDWSNQISVHGRWSHAVHRSMLVLRALTHAETGGIVAAPTTSLPEDPGGVRNWDYRFCWLRDSALTLEALLLHGRTASPLHWRNWLLRAVAGDPEDLQIMYGVAGERSLIERELDHLPGYADSRPVRVGNAAVSQFQGDVVGEVLIALAKLREAGVDEDDFSWPLQRSMLGYVTEHVDRKDQGLWEMRGDPHYFTHSRVMVWAALDRGVQAVTEYGLPGPAKEWARLRDQLREEILTEGVDAETGSFTQTYDNTEVDASLLQIPQTGFVAYDDPRMLATVERLEQELMYHGLLLRYRTVGTDGLTGDEHPFLACSFWLVEQYACTGRVADATALMDTLVGYTNHLGLLAEEYDPAAQRQMGNFPQAFSHLALVRAADALHEVTAGHPAARPDHPSTAVDPEEP